MNGELALLKAIFKEEGDYELIYNNLDREVQGGDIVILKTEEGVEEHFVGYVACNGMFNTFQLLSIKYGVPWDNGYVKGITYEEFEKEFNDRSKGIGASILGYAPREQVQTKY